MIAFSNLLVTPPLFDTAPDTIANGLLICAFTKTKLILYSKNTLSQNKLRVTTGISACNH